jgi:hypothetical protein
VDPVAGWRHGRRSVPCAAGAFPSLPGRCAVVALDVRTADEVRLAAAVRALAPRGRLLAPATAPLPDGVRELARDATHWGGRAGRRARLAGGAAAARFVRRAPLALPVGGATFACRARHHVTRGRGCARIPAPCHVVPSPACEGRAAHRERERRAPHEPRRSCTTGEGERAFPLGHPVRRVARQLAHPVGQRRGGRREQPPARRERAHRRASLTSSAVRTSSATPRSAPAATGNAPAAHGTERRPCRHPATGSNTSARRSTTASSGSSARSHAGRRR